MMRHFPHTSRRGFSLIEATMSVVIVAGLLVTSTAVFGNIARGQAAQTESRLGHLLARQLMSEITQKAFAQPNGVFGAQSGQTRATFPAVDCYDGYSASPPVSESGTAFSGYTGWTQNVAVKYLDPATLTPSVAATNLKQIVVTVTAPSQKTYQLSGLRSAFGPGEVTPTVRAAYVTGVSITLAGPTSAKTVYTGVHPMNGVAP